MSAPIQKKSKRDEKSFKSAIAGLIYIKQQNAEAKKRKLFAYIFDSVNRESLGQSVGNWLESVSVKTRRWVKKLKHLSIFPPYQMIDLEIYSDFILQRD